MYSQEKIIEKFRKVHGEKYDYSIVNYTNIKDKVKIICKEHGVFEQTPDSHIGKRGCPECTKYSKKWSTDNFVKQCKTIHGDKYDYSLVHYVNAKTKIKIICKEHGIFEQKTGLHLYVGEGCPKCNNSYHSNTETFIKKSQKVHNDKYDYSLVKYKNTKTKVKIICSLHGEFEQNPDNHLLGKGCPKCKESKGEKEIGCFLSNHKISHKRQYRFHDCRYKKPLPFDFYLPEHNICIEYDGSQHFYEGIFDTENETLETRKIRDKIKTDYCIKNNIQLIRIKYTESSIPKKLQKLINI